MFKFSRYLLLPIMLVNLTIAENLWKIFGFPMDLGLYLVTICLAFYVGLCSPYRKVVIAIFFVAIFARLFFTLGGFELAHIVSFASLAIIFIIAGAILYGRNPLFLHKQLTIYLGLSLPIMLLQILGVSSFFMGWNTGYLHDPLVFSLEDIGTFKEFQLYPTLFVGIDELIYSYGQARPVGLMHGSNPLSIFVSIAIALNFSIARTNRLTYSDLIITTVTMLLMSKMAFFITFILYFGALIILPAKRLLALRLITLCLFILSLYYILFPGLFMVGFSSGMVMEAIAYRLLDILRALGVENEYALIGTQLSVSNGFTIEGKSFSSISLLLKSKIMFELLFVLMTVAVIYLLRLRMMVRSLRQVTVYLTVLFACVLTQFAVPFVTATPFQLILGFAMYPLFKRIWMSVPRS